MTRQGPTEAKTIPLSFIWEECKQNLDYMALELSDECLCSFERWKVYVYRDTHTQIESAHFCGDKALFQNKEKISALLHNNGCTVSPKKKKSVFSVCPVV